MNCSIKMRLQVTGAVLVAFAIRLYFIWQFPFFDAGDTPIYQQLAENWLRHGVYGLNIFGRLLPVDMRTPGYPAFLAVIYSIFGQSPRAVMIAQAGIDVLTCVLAAAIAAVLAPKTSRSRVALAALWLAAVCPFTANYTAVVLTETLATFLTALALLVLVEAMRDECEVDSRTADVSAGMTNFAKRVDTPANMRWFLGGIVVGFGTLVRPETPLVLVGFGIVLVFLWRHPANWKKLASAVLLMAVGLVLPLLPWAARNWRTLHKVQFLSPRYGELAGEYTPVGFFAWEKTWLWRFADVFQISWNLNGDEIRMEDFPASAFDSATEKARVGSLIAQYDETKEMSPELDQQFAEIARERTERHPLRTYLEVPFLRGLAMWFTPRVEMLPLSGKFWPIGYWWEDSPSQYCYSMALFLGGITCGILALLGALKSRGSPAAIALVAFIVIRTAFLTTIETPEPRYVLECFPAVFALAAQFWAKTSVLARGT